MAKITRATQKIFGSTAGITQIGVFGSLAAGSAAYSSNPVTIQSLSNYLDGWYAAVVGENSPAIQDMNALCFLYAYQLAYLMQQGIAEWDSATTYYAGSLVQDGSGNIYVSLQNSNLNNNVSNISFWAPQLSQLSIQTYFSTSVTLPASSQFARIVPSSNAVVTLPALSSVNTGTKIIIKNASPTFTVQIQGSGSDTIDGSNVYTTLLNIYDSITVISNSITWDVI